VQQGRDRERGRERFPSKLHPERRAPRGAQSHDPDIITQAEITSGAPNRLSHPGSGLSGAWFSGEAL